MKIKVIFYADNLVLIAELKEGSQKSIGVLEDYVRIEELEINVEKTEVILCQEEYS